MRALSEHLKTDEGERWAIAQGVSPFDIQEWKEDPTKIDKSLAKWVKDIGMDKIRDNFNDQETLKIARQQQQQATELYQLTKKEKSWQLLKRNESSRSEILLTSISLI